MTNYQRADIDLARPGVPPRIYAAAGDLYTRFAELHLYEDGTPYTPPEDTTCMIGWHRGAVIGSYDKIKERDGTERSAWQIEGNVLRIELDWHITSVVGPVSVNVGLLDGQGARLSTWELVCEVKSGAAGEADQPGMPNESATEAADRAEAEADEAAAHADRANEAADRAAATMTTLEAIVAEGGPVLSVNGKTGVVNLTAEDIPNAGGYFEVSEDVPDQDRRPNSLYGDVVFDFGE